MERKRIFCRVTSYCLSYPFSEHLLASEIGMSEWDENALMRRNVWPDYSTASILHLQTVMGL